MSRTLLRRALAGPSRLVAVTRRRGLAVNPALDPVVPCPDRVLQASVRTEMGTIHSRALRDVHKRVPASLLGDRLPFVHLSVDTKELMPFLRRTHYQRELFTVTVEDGETVRILPQEVQFDTLKHFNVKHINFRRWPRDPVRHPVKLAVPLVFTHEETIPTVKAGGYVHDMFSDTGIPCLVRDPENVPRFFVADMRRSEKGDLRFEHLDIPPGVTIRRTARTTEADGKTIANFLVGRVKRVRG